MTVEPLGRSSLAGVVFYELIRFRSESARAVVRDACDRIVAVTTGALRGSLAAHAPYSVSADMFRAMGEAFGDGGANVLQ